MDAGLKLLTAHYPSAQVAALRGLAALPVVFVWALYAGGAAQLVSVRWPLHLIRGVLSVFMMITFTFALKELSLAQDLRAVLRRAAADRDPVDLHAGRARAARAVDGDRHWIRGRAHRAQARTASASAGRARWPCWAPRCAMRSRRCS